MIKEKEEIPYKRAKDSGGAVCGINEWNCMESVDFEERRVIAI